ncbi:MAG: hypothetical protein U1E36_02390 [Rickettsiales bacterium]
MATFQSVTTRQRRPQNQNWEAVFLCLNPRRNHVTSDDIDVRSQLAVMNAQIQTLTKTVDVLAEEVKSLTALANQEQKACCAADRGAACGQALWPSSASPLATSHGNNRRIL